MGKISWINGLAGWLAAMVLSGAASAATYYVDFDGGKDDAAGTAAAQAWKHCPGDPAAAAAAKSTKLAAGDTVIFKGGVVYAGEVALNASGEAGKPIILDGNTDGAFGTGKAIIDGSTPVTGWKHVASAEEVKGNAKWREIFCADVPGPVDWRTFNLSLVDQPLPVAQEPKMSDPFFQETVSEFHQAPGKMGSTFPGQIYFEKGTIGNSITPLFGVIAGQPAVVQPLPGGAFSVELNDPVTLKSIGIKPQPNYAVVKQVAILGDGKELLTVTLAPAGKDIQKFDLPAPVTLKKLTFKLVSAGDGETVNYTKIARIAAWTPDGKNILAAEDMLTTITDEKVLTQKDAHYYDGMWVGVHGGNNWVSFEEVKRFDPESHRLFITYFPDVTYKVSTYSFYNSCKLIDRAGEYSVEPTANPKIARVFLLPPKVQDDQPVGVGYSVRTHGLTLSAASHVVLRGLVIRRQGHGAASGIKAEGGADLTIADCEITQVQGSPALGVSNVAGVVVEKCYIHHNGSPDCRGMVLYHCKNVSTRFCRIIKNTGTAVDYYGCEDGDLRDNLVTDSRGMHANGLTLYTGNKNIIVERNVVRDSNVGLTFNEGTENIIVRNNLIDSGNKSFCVGIWGGVFKNVQFLNNTLVRSDPTLKWTAAVFSNSGTKFDGVIFRNNIVDGTSGQIPAIYEHNIYTRLGDMQKDNKLGEGGIFEPDLSKIFVDPLKGDYHLKPGSPAIGAGMDVGLKTDLAGVPIPTGRPPDIGAYQHQ